MPGMASVDLVDETYLDVAPAVAAVPVADPARWTAWWPDLALTVVMDRGVEGVRWDVRGALVGTAEVWLEAVGNGVVLHYYLRADPPDGPYDTTRPGGRRAADRERARRATAWKRSVWALKDELEAAATGGP
jgi:hypothetical protein